jgi:hypothetical protein
MIASVDWALGQRFPQGDVSVNGAKLSTQCCNALMFGSETCSDFTHYNFSHITIACSGKSGLGLVSMDGPGIGSVSNVSFNNVNLTLPGGHGTMSTGVPSDNGDYNPKSIGTRPAYGWYLHNISGITFTNSSVRSSPTTVARRSSRTPAATSSWTTSPCSTARTRRSTSGSRTSTGTA